MFDRVVVGVGVNQDKRSMFVRLQVPVNFGK